MAKKQNESSTETPPESGDDRGSAEGETAATTESETQDDGEADEDTERDSDDDAAQKDRVGSADDEDAPVDALETEAKERRTNKKARKKSAAARGRKTRRATPAPVLSEQEIDSPSRQTLGMLSVVAAATLVMWGVGRAKCNYREVGEGRKPRTVTLQERTRTPKDVAFEFQQAYATYDVDVASKLATAEAKTLVDKRKRECGSSCGQKHEELALKVTSVSELLKRTASSALARVWSDGNGTSGKHLIVLKREGRDWKVASYAKDDGKEVELPGEVTLPLRPAEGQPIPSGSAVPGAAPSAALPTPDPHAPQPAGSVMRPSRVPPPAASR